MASKSFRLGFVLGLGFWVVINLVERGSQLKRLCFDCDRGFGVPFRMFESESIGGNAHIVWAGVISNVVIFILSSFILGWLFNIIMNKFSARSLL